MVAELVPDPTESAPAISRAKQWRLLPALELTRHRDLLKFSELLQALDKELRYRWATQAYKWIKHLFVKPGTS